MRSAVLLVLQDENGDIVIVQKNPFSRSAMRGIWGFLAETQEEGETITETARRGVLEELGSGPVCYNVKQITKTRSPRGTHIFWASARIRNADRARPQSDIVAMKMVSPEEAIEIYDSQNIFLPLEVRRALQQNNITAR